MVSDSFSQIPENIFETRSSMNTKALESTSKLYSTQLISIKGLNVLINLIPSKKEENKKVFSEVQMPQRALEEALQECLYSDPGIVSRIQKSDNNGNISAVQETDTLRQHFDVTGAACINQYVVVRSLGQGSYARVRLCLNVLNQELYAIKTINRAFLKRGLINSELRQEEENERTLREIAIMKKLDHPNVVKLHEVIDPPGKENIVLVTEYLENGTLLRSKKIGKGNAYYVPLPEHIARKKFQMILKGLDYLHYHRIVHGDLKPENLLVSINGTVKIADFTCSRMVGHQHFTSGVYGTPAYHAPEIIEGTKKYNAFSADIWAIGVCLYTAVIGELPFAAVGIGAMYNKILNIEYKVPDHVEYSFEFWDLLSKIFKREEDRIELPDLFKHPWLTDHGKEKIYTLKELTNPPKAIEISENDRTWAIDSYSDVSFVKVHLKMRKYREGHVLFTQGEPTNYFYFIIEGRVSLYRSFRDRDSEVMIKTLELEVDEQMLLDNPVKIQNDDGFVIVNHIEAEGLQRRRQKQFCQSGEFEKMVAKKGPGQIIGEYMAPGQKGHHRFTAKADTTICVIKLSHEDLCEAFEREKQKQERRKKINREVAYDKIYNEDML